MREQGVRLLGEVRGSGKIEGHLTVFPEFFLPAGNPHDARMASRGPGELEVWAWAFVERDAPPEVKDSIRRATMRTFSLGGMFEQTTAKNWLEIQRVLRGYMARQRPFNVQMGIGHETHDSGGFPGKTITCTARWRRALLPSMGRDAKRGGLIMAAIAHPPKRKRRRGSARQPLVDATVQRAIEQFLYYEARLLDDRRIDEWYELLADDLHYFMPTPLQRLKREADREFSGPHEAALFDEDKRSIAQRIRRLHTGMAWAEDPRRAPAISSPT